MRHASAGIIALLKKLSFGKDTVSTFDPHARQRQSTDRRSAMVMSLELRGFRQKEIAQVLEMSEATVANIVHRQTYKDALRAKLSDVDDEFLRMKPKAFRALDNGLCSSDEGVGLRAAEMWFKGMGYKGFGRGADDGEGSRRVTAEDIATQLLSRGGGSVTITASASPFAGGRRSDAGRMIDAVSQGQDDKSEPTA